MESNLPQPFLMLMLDINKKYLHDCPPLNDFSFSKENPITSSLPFLELKQESLHLKCGIPNWTWCSLLLSNIRRVGKYFFYLAYMPLSPRKLAAVPHCKLALGVKRGKFIVEVQSNYCPHKRFPSLEPEAAHLSCYPPPHQPEPSYTWKNDPNASSELIYNTYK